MPLGPLRCLLLVATVGVSLALAPLAHAEGSLSITPGVMSASSTDFTVSGDVPPQRFNLELSVHRVSAAVPCPAERPTGDAWTGFVSAEGAFSMAGAIPMTPGQTWEPTVKFCGYLSSVSYTNAGAGSPAPIRTQTMLATAEASAPWTAAQCATAKLLSGSSYLGVFQGYAAWGVTVKATGPGRVDAVIVDPSATDTTVAEDDEVGFARIKIPAAGTYALYVSSSWYSKPVPASMLRPGTRHTVLMRFEPTVGGNLGDSSMCIKDTVATRTAVSDEKVTIKTPPLRVTNALRAVRDSLQPKTTAAAALRAGGYTAKVTNKMPGVATMSAYAGSGPGERVLLASGRATTTSTGTTLLKMRLTAAGKVGFKRGAMVSYVGTFKAAGSEPQSITIWRKLT